jgi:hypothetical protein
MPPECKKEEIHYFIEEVERMCGGLSMASDTAKWRLARKLNGIKLNGISAVRAYWDGDFLMIIISAKNDHALDQAYQALCVRFNRAQRAMLVT